MSSKVLVYRHRGKFGCFVGARILTGIMQFIANVVMMRPDALDNIISRGHVTALNEVFHVNLPTAIQKTKLV